MPILAVADLQPVFEDVARRVAAAKPTERCPVARRLYWVMRIDGEIRNGGVAQLIWNLHQQYDYDVLYESLEAIGAAPAKRIVERAVRYIHEKPRRTATFFENGPFDPAKPLRALTDKYYDLSPSVPALLLDYVEAEWHTPSFHAIIDRLALGHIMQTGFGDGDLIEAVEDANGSRVSQMLAAGLDTSQTDDNDRTLIMLALNRTDQQSARVEIIEQLVAAGADINQATTNGTALSVATRHGGQVRYLECLLWLNADLEAADGRGHTPIFGAVQAPSSLRLLLNAGGDAHHRSDTGLSPLGYALFEYGQCVDNSYRHDKLPNLRESIDMLLDHGCGLSPAPVQETPRTEPLTELALVAADPELLTRLALQPDFEHIPEARQDGVDVWTAAHEAARRGCNESLLVLATHNALATFALGASSLRRDAFAGCTPIDVAADNATADLLREHGVEAGVQRSHDVWILTYGGKPQTLVELIADADHMALDQATMQVALLAPDSETVLAWGEDGNLIIYEAMRAAQLSTRAEADEFAERCAAAGASTRVI